MNAFEGLLNSFSEFVWGPVMLSFLLGVGIFLTVGLRAMPWRKTGAAFGLLWRGRQSDQAGEITPFQALMTALSATIGTGNIAGVATAIALGGPGAVFWMWVTALFGMATKYAEAVLAVRYREVDEVGRYVGGPMYYIRSGLGPRWRWLAALFALFGMMASFGIGNMVQANSVADGIHSMFGVDGWVTGTVVTLSVGVVILGGVRRIAVVAGRLVPVMAIAYVAAAMIIILVNLDAVPDAFGLILQHAFTETAAAGGFVGATVWAAIRFGVARGVFSNEAGLGSAPIAHAAARTNNPVNQGMIAMLGTFIDTLVICTMTALVIILTGAWSSGETGTGLSALAFHTGLPGVGGYIVAIAEVVFAFTTILGWSYYGERCVEYLFGIRPILIYRVLWLVAIMVGTQIKLDLVWLIADVMNGLMALPNLVALVLLSPVLFKVTRDHFQRRDREC